MTSERDLALAVLNATLRVQHAATRALANDLEAAAARRACGIARPKARRAVRAVGTGRLIGLVGKERRMR